jgi:Lon protease-like protein
VSGPAAALLDDCARYARRFVVLNAAQADTVALWAAHTHVHDAFPCTPYLKVTSPEKRSGKTRLLEVLELLVRKPLPTANISDAALFRVVAEKWPTLLMDEVDAIFGRQSREREELRGLLCAGYRRGAVAHRMGGSNNTTLQTFKVYCPKAFAGIGDCLPDTIVDRAIPIRLKRRTREETIERFRHRDVAPAGEELRDHLADWLEPQRDHLAAARPALPDELDDRAQDVWEPLLAIADLAGGDWPQRARRAALALSSGDEREDESITALLLRDIHAFFESTGHDRVRTADLLAYLVEIEESPWGDWYGKTLSAHGLARLLKPYRIRTMPVWADGKTVKGYKLEQFADAFARVLGVRRVRTVRSESASQAGPNGPNPPNAYHANGDGPRLGDPGYALLLDRAYANGHLTDDELRDRLHLDALAARVRRERGAA